MPALARALGLVLTIGLGTPAPAQQPARPRTPVAAFDFRAEAVACLKEAYETALKYPDPADAARDIARVADKAWAIDRRYSAFLFGRAVEVADAEVRRAQARGADAVNARADALNAYARRDGPAAVRLLERLAARGEDPAGPREPTAQEREAQAALLCEAARRLLEKDSILGVRVAHAALDLGVLPPNFVDALVLVPDPREGPELLRRGLRVAGGAERPSLVRIHALAARCYAGGNLSLALLDGRDEPPQRWMLRPEARHEYARASEKYLDYAGEALARAARDGRPPALDPADVQLVAADAGLRRWLEARVPPEARSALAAALARVPLPPAADPTEAELADAREFTEALGGTPAAVLEASARVRDPLVADALRLVAADRAPREIEDEKARDAVVQKALETTADERRRECAEDHVVIARAVRETGLGHWAEAAKLVGHLSRPELRAQLAGALAVRAAKARRAAEVAQFAAAARKASDVAPRTPRSVQGLLRAATARFAAGDRDGAVASLTDALFVFDRMTGDDERPPAVGRAAGLLTLHEVSPYVAVDRAKPGTWPLARALAALVGKDPLGARFVATSLKTPERRVEALIALAGVLAGRAKRAGAEELERRAASPADPPAGPESAP